MFPWPVRLLGVALAGVELLLLTMNAFGWHFRVPGFEEFMRWLGDQFSSFFAPIEAMIRDLLAPFDFHLPKLAPHWHHIFVLMWLLMGSTARLFAQLMDLDARPLSGPWLHKLLAFDIPMILWAFVWALVAAVAVGTQPLASLAVLWWPLATLLLFLMAPLGLTAAAGRRRYLLLLPGIAAVLFAAGYLVTEPMKRLFGFVVDSPPSPFGSA